MIKSFEALNFRNVACNNLNFARINILVGPNNSGKSNFIKALSFAANMVNSNTSESTGLFSELKRNGWLSVINKNSENKNFNLIWDFQLNNIQKNLPTIRYTLKINTSKKREENYIVEESLDNAKHIKKYKQPYNYFICKPNPDEKKNNNIGIFSTAGMSSKRNNRLYVDVNKYESVLLQMDQLFFNNKEMFSTPFVRDEIRQVLDVIRRYFRSFYSYSCTSFNIAAIRELQDEQADGSNLKKDGSNFVNVFFNTMENDPYFKKRYLHILKKLIRDCKDIQVRNAGGKIWMELKFRDYYFPLSEVSDGTVHLLVLLLLLTLPKSKGISMLAIDEPEMNLHPAWQKLLANEILLCQGFNQCFISTHSPDFLDEFTEGFLTGNVNLFVFDPSSKLSIRQLKKETLISELKDWTLGDLYRVGDPMIGGWPQ